MSEELTKFWRQSTPEQVRQIRKRLGMTQAQLAGRMKITQAAVSLLEKGDELRGSTLSKVAGALGVTVLYGNLIPPWMSGEAPVDPQEDGW